MAVIRLGYANLKVTNLALAVQHYTDVVGLLHTETVGNSAYLRGRDEQDHHCLVLTESSDAGLERVSFKVSDPDDLAEIENRAASVGCRTERVSDGEVPGIGEAVRLQLPSEQVLEFFYHADKLGYPGGMDNPDPVLDDEFLHGAAAQRLDHLLITTPDHEANLRVLRDLLDFGLSEQLMDDDGNPLAVWLYCSNTMHDLAMSGGPPGMFHHIAFWVDNRADVIRAVDVLKKKGVPTLEYGITRHGISGGSTVYFYDPSGNRNEIFNEPYVTTPVPGRVAPVSWDLKNAPRGVFYYENELDMSFFEKIT